MLKYTLSGLGDEIAPDLPAQLEHLGRLGIRHIELRNVDGKCIVHYSLDEVAQIKKILAERGFSVSAVASPVGKIMITDDFEPHLELFRHTLRVAEVLGSSYVRLFSFYIPDGEDPTHYRDEVLRRWREFLRAAAGTGLVLLHENEKKIYGDTPQRCRDLLDAMGSKQVRAIFDFANFIQSGAAPFPDGLELLRDYTVYVHIKDAFFADRSVVPAGYGDGKVKTALLTLFQGGFDGFLTLEPHLSNFTGFGALEPDAPKLPEGYNPEKFTIAYQALMQILQEINDEIETPS